MARNKAIKQAVGAGFDLSVVSTHTLELELETLRLVILDVAGFPLTRQWHLVYRRGRHLSPAVQAPLSMPLILGRARGAAPIAPTK